MQSNTIARNAGDDADKLIGAEIAIQDKMWGASNDRADASKGQLLQAALATVVAIDLLREHPSWQRETAFSVGKYNYPADWSGFRDYGSDVANLAVAAAYLRQEIKRRIEAGEDTTRTSRNQPYKGDQPNMSSTDAAGAV